MTTYGVIGNGKLGRILKMRPNFVSIGGDLTDVESLWKDKVPVDVIVNCAGMTSVDDCEQNQDKAILVNVRGTFNLHEVYGERVLTISSDHVFSGRNFFSPKESTKLSPANHYGWTKLGAETTSKMAGGKILRLSRAVSPMDTDMGEWILSLFTGQPIRVPTFFKRNYLMRNQAVDGIEYMVRNYDKMPDLVHYGSIETVTMFDFMQRVAKEFGIDPKLVLGRDQYDETTYSPRPQSGGFSTVLAKRRGFPMYHIDDVVKEFVAYA